MDSRIIEDFFLTNSAFPAFPNLMITLMDIKATII